MCDRNCRARLTQLFHAPQLPTNTYKPSTTTPTIMEQPCEQRAAIQRLKHENSRLQQRLVVRPTSACDSVSFGLPDHTLMTIAAGTTAAQQLRRRCQPDSMARGSNQAVQAQGEGAVCADRLDMMMSQPATTTNNNQQQQVFAPSYSYLVLHRRRRSSSWRTKLSGSSTASGSNR